ncbi:AhpC/TSA family protein [Basidiobolus meristosporus CBS 931.73]|uniref:thioredoxin-dependent peroxiredoxin n=1 Tax=Basidiobolus meristosporus CBS 931.73 TaxID=1314790 RepID=A0A1Y1X614_9FUNG|nr:AhpC/TSA family protein [Basidiobolus meristosporus CBS 931.73]|eukprot:ORX81108.1 AhpC/TSA family protein [Basidiobolus meristosporus CBS 931.73]
MTVAIQKAAPSFTATALVNGEFKPVSLEDFKGKYLVLFFYPMDFTFVCPTEIIAFNDRVKEFEALDCAVVACSVDSEFSHFAWVNMPRKNGGLGNMEIPILSDITKKISRDYGVLLEEEGVALRGLFIIDPKQNVRIMQVNDLPVGRSVDETLRLVEALQFTDVHGEVCPANWTKGSDTIKPDVSGSKDFFAKQ